LHSKLPSANEFSDEMMKDKLGFLFKTIGIASLGIYFTFKMKRIAFINRLFFGSSK
jgi:hypothetical protein